MNVGGSGLPSECKGFASSAATRLVRACGSYGFRSPTKIEVLLTPLDGSSIVTIDTNRKLVFWDPTSGEATRSLLLDDGGSGRLVTSAVVARDGKAIFTGGADGNLRLHDLATGRPIFSVFATSMDAPCTQGSFPHVPFITDLALASDGRYIATYGESESIVRLWDATTGVLVGELAGMPPIVFSPDGRSVFLEEALLDLRTGRSLARFFTDTGDPIPNPAAAFSPDGKHICISGGDGSVQLWDPRTCVTVWTAQTPNRDLEMTSRADVWFSSDGSKIITHSIGDFHVFGAADGRLVSKGRFRASEVAYAPRVDRLYGCETTLLKVIDLATGRELGAFGHTGTIEAIAISKGRVVTGGADGLVKLWDVATGASQRTFESRHKSAIACVAFSSDGRTLFAGWSDGVRAWSLDTGEQIAELQPISKQAHGVRDLVAIVPQPNSSRIALMVKDGHVRLWDVETKSEVWDVELRAHALSFSADGTTLTVMTVRTIEMLDARTGAKRETFENPNWDGQRGQPHAFMANGERAVRVLTTKGLTFGPLRAPAAIAEGSSDVNLVLALSPDERIAVTSIVAGGTPSESSTKNGPKLAIWDVAKETRIDTIDLSSSSDTPVCAAIEGETLFVGTARGMLLQFALRIPAAVAGPRSFKGGTVAISAVPMESAPHHAALEETLIEEYTRCMGLYAKGRFADARDVATAAQVRALDQLGETHRLTRVGYAMRGEAVRALGDPEGAAELLREALRLSANQPPTDPEVIQTIVNLGRACIDQDDLTEAEEHFTAALDRARKIGPTAPQVALALNSLGYVYVLKSEFATAERFLREALAIVAPPDPEGLRILHNLGRALGQGGKTTEAEVLLIQALDGRRTVLGPEHPETIESTATLATLYFVTKQPERAEPLTRSALELTRRVHGADHPFVADRLVDVALIANARGDSSGALPAMREAAMIRRRRLGPDHPKSQWVVRNLFGLQRTLGLPEGLPD